MSPVCEDRTRDRVRWNSHQTMVVLCARKWPRPEFRRGALLLEVVVAFAIFVVAALAVLSSVQRATAAALLARDQSHAMDLARSALAKIESGIARPETLNGPVPPWGQGDSGEVVNGDSGERFNPSVSVRDAPARASGWELEISTRATAYEGLTAVTVVARRRRGDSTDAVSASYALTQFVRLTAQVGGNSVAGGGVP